LTYADLEFIPKEREGDRHELFDGVLVVTPSPIPLHQRLLARLFREFDATVGASRLGEVFLSPIDVVFSPRIVAVPDLVFVSQANLAIVGPQAIEGALDLILEILSPSTRRRDLRIKRGMYERCGVREYWLVDPKVRSVTVLVLREGRNEETPATDAVASSVVPGLEIDQKVLFAGL
jgi:Uma2 family endonuclease